MRFVQAALFLAVTTSPALAQREPQIVIPGRRDVPVIINGVNASWGVVVGEFGLDRPGAMAPVVIYQPLLASVPYAVPSYFPKTGVEKLAAYNVATSRELEDREIRDTGVYRLLRD